MTESIRVNFEAEIPLFPLPDTVLLPHAVIPLHIFEPRYREMINACLDGPGQIALATFADASLVEPNAVAAVRSVSCVGQIIEHNALPDGRYNILLHGVCRARIDEVIEPVGDRAFRLARLSPIEASNFDDPMDEVRGALRRLLAKQAMQHLRGIDTFQEWVDRSEMPTHALLELLGFTLIRDTDVKYSLLAEPDVHRRADIVVGEMRHLARLVRDASAQGQESWPKGMSWN